MEKKELLLNEEEKSVVEKFDSFEEIEEIVTASNAGTIGCCL